MENIYDSEEFFGEYSKMLRSRKGLSGAGEWSRFRLMFPELCGKRVLDLGCGYGWHCKYAAERGAGYVLGIDSSEKMIGEAKRRNSDPRIEYRVCSIEEYEYPENEFDCAVSNLALHYIEDIEAVYRKIYRTLRGGGAFLLNIEHPTFTAGVDQDWYYGPDGKPLFWPVDDYFYPGERETKFLGQSVKKFHHTLTQIVMGLIDTGFKISALGEAGPPAEMMDVPGMADEMRRPMMLLIKAVK